MKKLLVCLIAGFCLVGGILMYVFFRETKPVEKGTKGAVSGNSTVSATSKDFSHRVSIRRLRERNAQKRRQQLKEKHETEEKPVINLSDLEYAGLNELQRKVMTELQEALDNDDFSTVKTVLARMRELGRQIAREKGDVKGQRDWTRHMPVVMRQKAVEALGWFGADAMAELVEFVTDADSDVAQQAMDAFEQAMEDFSLSDYEKSEVIKQVCQVVTDEDFVDWMMTEAQNSRHSVGIDTFLYINRNGTDVAKSKVQENIEFFTGEDTVTTEEAAKQWLEENPDDPDDDEFYGGITD